MMVQEKLNKKDQLIILIIVATTEDPGRRTRLLQSGDSRSSRVKNTESSSVLFDGRDDIYDAAAGLRISLWSQ